MKRARRSLKISARALGLVALTLSLLVRVAA
jgi:hypothetical protein